MKLEVLAHGTALPLQLTIAEGVNKNLYEVLKENSSGTELGAGALFVCGTGGFTEEVLRAKLNDIAPELLSGKNLFRVAKGDLDEVRNIDEICARHAIKHIVAVGGGRVIDVAKSVKGIRNIKLTILPTALSSDCLASPVVVIKNSARKSTSMAGGMPDSILIDTEVTRSAPALLTLSGLGDIISNSSAVLDYQEKISASNHTSSGFARILSESAYRMVLGLERSDLVRAQAHTRIAEGLILSGLAMAFAGDSSPCSGAEHLISHAIDALQIADSTHGLQVSVGTAFCMALRLNTGSNPEAIDIVNFMRRMDLPISPSSIGVGRKSFMKAVKLAPETRFGRSTILNKTWSEEDFNNAMDTVESWV